MAELSFNDYKSTMVLKDEFTINDTSKLKDMFIEILTKADVLDLIFDEELKCDAAFLQLFFSAIKAFFELGIKVSIYVKDRDSFISTFRQYGFTILSFVEILQKNQSLK